MKKPFKPIQERIRPLFVLPLLFILSCTTASFSTVESTLQPTGRMEEGVRTFYITAVNFEFIPSQMIVRKGETVKIVVTSADDNHGLAIPAFDVDTAVKPDEHNELKFTPDRRGRFQVECSEFCGLGHSWMEGELIVLPQRQERE